MHCLGNGSQLRRIHFIAISLLFTAAQFVGDWKISKMIITICIRHLGLDIGTYAHTKLMRSLVIPILTTTHNAKYTNNLFISCEGSFACVIRFFHYNRMRID